MLGDFTEAEEELVKPVVDTTSQVIECILTEGVTEAMNKFNRRSKNS